MQGADVPVPDSPQLRTHIVQWLWSQFAGERLDESAHPLHWLDALTWLLSLIFKAARAAVRAARN